MRFESFLDIKLRTLHNPMIVWLTRCYDPACRSIVVPGRGRIAVNEESVRNILGIPQGDVEVRYAVDAEIEAALAPVTFPGDDKTSLTTRVAILLRDYRLDDDRFKRMWIMYVMCTILAPTTRNRVSSRCYPAIVGDNFC